MGRQKLLLTVDGKPILRHAVERIRDHVDHVVVVTGPDEAPIREPLVGLPVRFAVNPHPERGQGTSIAAGIAALGPDVTAAIVVLGDQPAVPADVITSLLDAFQRTGTMIVAPVYQGLQGTPVVFHHDVFNELVALTGDAGARAVVQRDPGRVEKISFDFAMPIDVDTPEDYARLTGDRAGLTGDRARITGQPKGQVQ